MEEFHKLITSKNYLFSMLKGEMQHAEQTGNFDWPAARNKLIEIIDCGLYDYPDYAYFEFIYDLLNLYECKEAKVLNDFIKYLCRQLYHIKSYDDSFMKVAYYDFVHYPMINPCQEALDFAHIRSLRFLLESGVPYLGLDGILLTEIMGRSSTEPNKSIELDILTPVLKKRRERVVSINHGAIMNYLLGVPYHDGCYEKLGLHTDPSTTEQISYFGTYFPVFKISIKDAQSQMPEMFRRDIGDFIFVFNFIRCYRMIFNTIPEPIVTFSELKEFLLEYKHSTDCLEFNIILQEFPKFFPECTGPVTPRSLKHLCKCQVRQNIRMSHLFPNSILFPKAVRSLPLPEPLKDYILDIDESWIYN